jgi:NAD(P)H-flavin reductase
MDGQDPRPFSIANAPRDNNTIDFHIRNSGQNTSHAFCTNIAQGQRVYVSEPHGSLKIENTKNPLVFLAGGTGISPFLAMMEASDNKSISLYWGASSESEFYVRPHHQGLCVYYCTDIYPVDAYLKNPIDDADIYMAGPPAMVKDSCAKLLAAGVEPSRLFYDE